MNRNQSAPKGRYLELFQYGAEEQELDRCLADTWKRLIVAGAKGNIPPSAQQRAAYIARLQPKAMAVVREWFRTKANFSKMDEGDAAVAVAPTRLPKSGDTGKAAWRQVLYWFCRDEVPSIVQEMLAQAPQAPVVATAPASSLPPSASAPAPVPAPVPAPASVPAPAEQDMVARATTPTRLEWIRHRPLNGLRMEQAAALPVLGYVKTVLDSGTAFIRPVGVLHEGQLVELTPDQAKGLFPLTGDLLAAPGTLRGHWPKGAAGFWTAEYHGGDGGSRWAVSPAGVRAFELFDVPVVSTDPDGVRAWLQTRFQHRGYAFPIFRTQDGLLFKLPGEALEPAHARYDDPLESFREAKIIRTSDGRSFAPDNMLGEVQPFDCAPASTWLKRLIREAVEAGCLTAITKAQVNSLADFALAASEPGRRASFARALGQLRQAEELRQFLGDATEMLLALPAVRQEIDSAIAEARNQLLAEKSLIQAQIRTLQSEKDSLKERLDKERKNAKATLEALRNSARQQEEDIRRRVHTVFEQAVAEGIETLARAEVFHGLLAQRPRGSASMATLLPIPAPAPAPAPATIPSRGQELPAWAPIEAPAAVRDASRLQRRLEDVASRHAVSELLLCSLLAASAAAGAVGLAGPLVPAVASALSEVVAGGTLCQVSVSGDMFGPGDLLKAAAVVRRGDHAWATSLGDFLHKQHGLGMGAVVLLKGVNRAPPEAVLPELLEAAVSDAAHSSIAWGDRSGIRMAALPTPTVILLSFVTGRSTFPLPAPLAASLPLLPASQAWEANVEPDNSLQPSLACLDAAFWQSIGAALPQGACERLRECAIRLGMSEGDAARLAEPAFSLARVGANGGGNSGATMPLYDTAAIHSDPQTGLVLSGAYEIEPDARQ